MAFLLSHSASQHKDLTAFTEQQPKILHAEAQQCKSEQYDILKADYDELDAHTKEIQARLDEADHRKHQRYAQYQGLDLDSPGLQSGDLVAAAQGICRSRL